MDQAEILEILESFDANAEVELLLNGSVGISNEKVEDFFKSLGYTSHQRIGGGAYRIAFRAGDICIKIAKSVDGRCCNEFESLFYNEFSHAKQREYLPEWYWNSSNHWIVIWEFVVGEHLFDSNLCINDDYKKLFPDFMTWDWHGNNVIVRLNNKPCVIDFTANSGNYDVKATMATYNKTNDWKPVFITAGQLKYPPSPFSFVKLVTPYKSCNFAYVINCKGGYDAFPIFDASPNAGHDFHWLTRIKGFKEEQILTTLSPKQVAGEVNAPSVFEHLLETLDLD